MLRTSSACRTATGPRATSPPSCARESTSTRRASARAWASSSRPGRAPGRRGHDERRARAVRARRAGRRAARPARRALPAAGRARRRRPAPPLALRRGHGEAEVELLAERTDATRPLVRPRVSRGGGAAAHGGGRGRRPDAAAAPRPAAVAGRGGVRRGRDDAGRRAHPPLLPGARPLPRHGRGEPTSSCRASCVSC